MKATGQSSFVGPLVSIATVAVFGAGFLLFLTQRESSPARKAAARVSEHRSPEREPAQSPARARAPETFPAVLMPPAPAPAPTTPPEADEPELTDEERAAEKEARFVADGAPTKAASSRELGLRRAFSAQEMRGLADLKNIECRASQCRLEVVFAEAGADLKVVERLFASHNAPYPAGGTFGSRNVEADGKVSATVFLRAPKPGGWAD